MILNPTPRAVVAAHTLDYLSFAVAVTIAPVLLPYEAGFIGAVTGQLGLLGALAWKMAGLSVILALATYVHPRARHLLLATALLVGVIGLAANTYALTQVM
jgi:hypothetical protein